MNEELKTKPRNYAEQIRQYRAAHGCSLKEARDAIDAGRRSPPADAPKKRKRIGDALLDAPLYQTDPEFMAWVAKMPKDYWADYDLSACRLGWIGHAATLAADAPQVAQGRVEAWPDARRKLHSVVGHHNGIDETLTVLDVLDSPEGLYVRVAISQNGNGETQAARVTPTAAPASRCPGIPAQGCKYTAPCNQICNKCGHVHNAHLLVTPTAASADDALSAVGACQNCGFDRIDHEENGAAVGCDYNPVVDGQAPADEAPEGAGKEEGR